MLRKVGIRSQKFKTIINENLLDRNSTWVLGWYQTRCSKKYSPQVLLTITRWDSFYLKSQPNTKPQDIKSHRVSELERYSKIT